MGDYKKLFIVVIIIFVFVAIAVILTSFEKKDIIKLTPVKEVAPKPKIQIEELNPEIPGFPQMPQKETRVTNQEVQGSKEKISPSEKEDSNVAESVIEEEEIFSESSPVTSGQKLPVKPTEEDRIKALPKGRVLY
ncbi:MAG: hypothetical protein V1674_07085 [Candidatus Omnitrophota bacterium]